MKIFLTCTSFLPSYGGPARSVLQLAETLSESGNEVGVWAPDLSATKTPLLNVDTSIRPFAGKVAAALHSFGIPDVIHDNGVWLPHNHDIAKIAQRNHIPRVVSIRGMLLPWARKHKRVKKWLAWIVYQHRDLLRASALHATSEIEAKSLQRLAHNIPVWIIPNGVDTVKSADILEYNKGNTENTSKIRIALFVGRLYPVKGLPMLLDAWAKVRPIGWRLIIAGPDESCHKAVLERKILQLQLSDVVEFAGPLTDEEKWRFMQNADIFICPSYTENFGIAIAEALSCGTPVITTTGTPWKSIMSLGMGWWVPAETNAIAKALRAATTCTSLELQAMGRIGRSFVSMNFKWPGIGKRFIEKYQSI